MRWYFSLMMLAFTLQAAVAAAEPVHVQWAKLLIDNLEPQHNIYGTNPNYLTWQDSDGAPATTSRNECSTFVTNLVKHAYNLSDRYFSEWIDSTSPYARQYHDAIVARNRFDHITDIEAVEAGDILAIKFLHGGGTYTGHMAVFADKPVLTASSSPFISGTRQYLFHVYDTTQSGHGRDDTRFLGNRMIKGAGKGPMRIYVSNDGRIRGHAWSNEGFSSYHAVGDRALAIGRLNLGSTAAVQR